MRSEYGDVVVDAALADFHHRISEGKKIDYPAAYVAGSARHMVERGHVPATTTDPATLTDRQLRRALRATRGNGADQALIGAAFARGFTVAEVADLTASVTTEYVADIAARITRRSA